MIKIALSVIGNLTSCLVVRENGIKLPIVNAVIHNDIYTWQKIDISYIIVISFRNEITIQVITRMDAGLSKFILMNLRDASNIKDAINTISMHVQSVKKRSYLL